ncbi:MAG TPA: DUF2007 domain-containing protein [Opitutaceae bacterium]
MKEIFVDRDYTRVGYLQSQLDAAGIAAFIQNQHTHNSMAELPLPIFWPRLCVVDDADLPRALQIVAAFRHAAAGPGGPDVTCAHCRALVPADFEICWSCERPMPAQTAP